MQKKIRLYRKANFFYHHELVRNISNLNVLWGKEDYKISTNSLGFRDKNNREIPLKNDIYRIILMGDSFTESVGVNWENSFPGILSENLIKKNIEILNAGNIGYSPKIYYLKTKYLIENVKLKFDEIIVFIDISDLDNESIYEDFDPENHNFFKKLIIKHSSYSFVYRVFINKKISFQQGIPYARDIKKKHKMLTNWWSGGREGRVEAWDITDSRVKKGFQLAFENMSKLLKICKENNIKVKLIVYPWQYTITDKNHPHEFLWEKFAKKHNISFTTLFAEFFNRCDFQGKSCDNFFIPNDVHWSAEGHKFVAKLLLDKISF